MIKRIFILFGFLSTWFIPKTIEEFKGIEFSDLMWIRFILYGISYMIFGLAVHVVNKK